MIKPMLAGIEEHDLVELRRFVPFYQVQGVSNVSQRTKGTGLGMVVAHRIATSLGGRVEIDSELGRPRSTMHPRHASQRLRIQMLRHLLSVYPPQEKGPHFALCCRSHRMTPPSRPPWAPPLVQR